jgi:lipooligosaccharide transport system permease protein
MAKQFFSDLLYFPKYDRGALCVWRRNFLYFKQTFISTLAWIFVEPLLYVFALGFGLGRFVSQIDGQSYAQFIAPAMIATSGMFVAFFEGTYATYTKLSRQNTYQTIILAPVSSDEVVLGELIWITSKALISMISVAIVLGALGLIQLTKFPAALFVLTLMCWVFAAMGIWLASLAKSYEWFTYSQSGLIMPMSLFCGTYFPLSQLPEFVIGLSYALPLTHGLMGARMFFAGDFNSMFFINVFYLLFVAVVFTNLAAARFQRKLVI